ncbi:unnamed protein product [Toxocara canis]|nr:unnamed protein product [Toxocara canis]
MPALLNDFFPNGLFIEHLTVGLTNMILSTILATLQTVTLVVFATDPIFTGNPSYLIMLNLSVADLVQLTFHILSGFFIIFQSTFHSWIDKVSGALINSGCVAYTQMTMLLAINRFFIICYPHHFQSLFTIRSVKIWIVCVWLFGASFFSVYMSPIVGVSFTPSDYMWGVVGQQSVLLGYCEYYSALFAMIITFTAYVVIASKLVRTPKSDILASRTRSSEKRILLQAVIISSIVAFLQYMWYNYETFVAPSKWAFFAINLLWIVTCGINPLLYLFLNV